MFDPSSEADEAAETLSAVSAVGRATASLGRGGSPSRLRQISSYDPLPDGDRWDG
jgi:hypothetical protein